MASRTAFLEGISSSEISNALPYYIFENETTSAHLRSMMNKIESVLNAHVVDK